MFEHTVLCLNINLFMFVHKTPCSNIELKTHFRMSSLGLCETEMSADIYSDPVLLVFVVVVVVVVFKPPPPIGSGGYMFSGRPSVPLSVRP